MTCPKAHEWYEAACGLLPRDRDRDLGRHLAECPDCRAVAEDVRETAGDLQRFAEATRTDVSADGAEALFRRARMHGLLGRKPRRSIGAWAGRSRWVRWGMPAAVAAAAVFLIVLGITTSMPQPVRPEGALEQLVRAGQGVKWAQDLRPLGPVARAAVTEELARPEPRVDQVADLLLVAYISERPRQDRQAGDVDFLLDQVWARRRTARAAWRGPMLASTAVATQQAGRTLIGDLNERPFAAAKRRMLDGRYRAALDVMPADGQGNLLRAWCLAALGHKAEAALVLSEADGVSGTPMGRVLEADLALEAGEVTRAVKAYEDLAALRNRYWFAAGYLYRYELRDARSAGECFARLGEGPLGEYSRQTFSTELAMARAAVPDPLAEVDFDEYTPGPLPKNWVLVRTKDGEFGVVSVLGGRALSQGPGTEWLTGEPEWADYTVQVDVKMMKASGDYAVAAVAYRRADHSGYALELTPQRLRIVKQIDRGRTAAPLVGQTHHLVLPPAEGWWYTLKVRVQHVDGGVNVAGKVWRSDTPEPLGWHVAWTDAGQPGVGPLEGGRAGVQVRGARVLVDDVVVTRNVSSEELLAASP